MITDRFVTLVVELPVVEVPEGYVTRAKDDEPSESQDGGNGEESPIDPAMKGHAGDEKGENGGEADQGSPDKSLDP